MKEPDLTVHDAAEAADLLIMLESQIRSARALYKEVREGTLIPDEDVRDELMTNIEEVALRMAATKAKVAASMMLRVYPIKIP